MSFTFLPYPSTLSFLETLVADTLKSVLQLGAVAHTCNPKALQGGGGRIT